MSRIVVIVPGRGIIRWSANGVRKVTPLSGRPLVERFDRGYGVDVPARDVPLDLVGVVDRTRRCVWCGSAFAAAAGVQRSKSCPTLIE